MIYRLREINQRLAVAYHQCEALYIIRNLLRNIIKPQGIYTLARDEIQPVGLMISTTLRAVMIYQACGLDKKRSNFCLPKVTSFLVREMGLEPIRDYHTPLKRARLPIPPLPRTFVIIAHASLFVNSFFKKITENFYILGEI